MVYGTYNELVTGGYKPTYNWGAPHCSYNGYMIGIWCIDWELTGNGLRNDEELWGMILRIKYYCEELGNYMKVWGRVGINRSL